MWDKNTRKIHPIKFGNKIYIPPTCYIIHILDKKEILTILEKNKSSRGYSSNISHCVN